MAYEPQDPVAWEAAMQLGSEDGLAMAILNLATASFPITEMMFPGWKEEVITHICAIHEKDATQMMGLPNEKPMKLGADLLHIAVAAITISIRLQMEIREKAGVEADDDAEALCDPAFLLQSMVEQLPSDEYYEAGLDSVRKSLGFDRAGEGNIIIPDEFKNDPRVTINEPEPDNISSEDAKSLEDWFDMDSDQDAT